MAGSTEPAENGRAPIDQQVHDVLDESDSDTLSLDDAFTILSNQRRRLCLRYLDATDGPVTIGELAEKIAAVENETTVDALSSAERKRVYVALHQYHLPQMDAQHAIRFDKSRGTIEQGEHATALCKYLDLSVTHFQIEPVASSTRSPYLLGIMGISLLVVGLSQYVTGKFLPVLAVLVSVVVVLGVRSLLSVGDHDRATGR